MFKSLFRDIEMIEKDNEIIKLTAYNNELRDELGELECNHEFGNWELIFEELCASEEFTKKRGDLIGQFKCCLHCGFAVKRGL